MRLRYGPVPEDPEFAPEAEGWRGLREPGPLAMQVIALPVALALILVDAALLFLALWPAIFVAHQAVVDIPAWAWLAILALVIPVHECLHVVFHPDGGASARSVIGLWLSRAVFYAYYAGPMSRNRMLLVLAGPYLVLALLPIALIALAGAVFSSAAAAPALALLSAAGSVIASGDAVGFVLLARQVPRGATVRNQGWRTYWKQDEASR